ncbi:hypothetical protein PO377_08855 [Atlantibacter hermannii]
MKAQLLLLLAFIHLPAIAQSIDIAMIAIKKQKATRFVVKISMCK